MTNRNDCAELNCASVVLNRDLKKIHVDEYGSTMYLHLNICSETGTKEDEMESIEVKYIVNLFFFSDRYLFTF